MRSLSGSVVLYCATLPKKKIFLASLVKGVLRTLISLKLCATHASYAGKPETDSLVSVSLYERLVLSERLFVEYRIKKFSFFVILSTRLSIRDSTLPVNLIKVKCLTRFARSRHLTFPRTPGFSESSASQPSS